MELTKLPELRQQVKYRLGISTEVKDSQIDFLIQGVVADFLNRYGIVVNEDDFGHLSTIVNLAHFRYENNTDGIPRHLDLQIKDLIITYDV